MSVDLGGEAVAASPEGASSDGQAIEDAIRALVPDDWRNSREWVVGGLVAVLLRRFGPVALARLKRGR